MVIKELENVVVFERKFSLFENSFIALENIYITEKFIIVGGLLIF